MNKTHLKRIKKIDAVAAKLIIAGGFMIIAGVIAILLLIAKETVPLFLPSKAEKVVSFTVDPNKYLALGADDYLETGYGITSKGKIHFFDFAKKTVTENIKPWDSNSPIKELTRYNNELFSIQLESNKTILLKITFAPSFDSEGKRSIEHTFEILKEIEPSLGTKISLLQKTPEEEFLQITFDSKKTLKVTKEVESESLFGDNKVELIEETLSLSEIQGNINRIVPDQYGVFLYASTDLGEIIRIGIGPQFKKPVLLDIIENQNHTIPSLKLVFGDVSLCYSLDNGDTFSLSTVSIPNSSRKKLVPIHTLNKNKKCIQEILPSQRNKCLYFLHEDGSVSLENTTNERHILDIVPDEKIITIGLANRDNALVTHGKNNTITLYEVKNPHPEFNFQAIFGKVWYESYDKPEYVWQSSSGNDDFEPKLSLVPLIFGSIKGTLYAMLFAAPLALLGAMYLSHFTTFEVRKVIKPMVEILASIPSVVIGFLAALWFAPKVEKNILGFFTFLPTLIICLFLFLLLWSYLERFKNIRNLKKGYEFLSIIPAILIAFYVSTTFGPILEETFFQGHFQTWLFNVLDVRYDQRNCFIIAFALGFAVIPIIFTISDDALTRVPPSLTAASLALGANRWQTMRRIILPSASPGIFAALMIGLGRAVGETMIVLMATGNTPIIDWNILNGMRTLSANIAVEIPEAPVDGTLYRVLFLSAVLLFLLTSILNTIGEVVRQRLRKKYGKF